MNLFCDLFASACNDGILELWFTVIIVAYFGGAIGLAFSLGKDSDSLSFIVIACSFAYILAVISTVAIVELVSWLGPIRTIVPLTFIAVVIGAALIGRVVGRRTG